MAVVGVVASSADLPVRRVEVSELASGEVREAVAVERPSGEAL